MLCFILAVFKFLNRDSFYFLKYFLKITALVKAKHKGNVRSVVCGKDKVNLDHLNLAKTDIFHCADAELVTKIRLKYPWLIMLPSVICPKEIFL